MKNHVFHFILSLIVLSLFSLLSACSNAENENAPPHFSHKSGEVPKAAVLIESNAKNTQAIQQAMSFVLNGRKIKLHRNAFTQSPHHLLEKKSLKHTDGFMLEAPKANRFSLFIFNNRCYLTHNNQAQKIPLNNVGCQPFHE